MRPEEKTHIKNSTWRVAFVLLAVLIQIMVLYALFSWLNQWSALIGLITTALALVLAFHIYGLHVNGSFKTSWMVLLLTFPMAGFFLYVLFGHKGVTRRMRRRFEEIDPKLLQILTQDEAVAAALEEADGDLATQCRYIREASRYPVYGNTGVRFFAQASDGLEAQLAELARAERFIFMEYHAIQEAQSFERVRAVLADRVRHGVEVRVLYDDIGSMGFIDPGFIRRMEAIGVQCRMFNPVMPVVNFFMNNRDHRKITVIDGRVGYTGGYNLADEYFNITHPFGHWKDTGVELRGEAVEALTVMFLEMWNAMRETDTDFSRYFPKERPEEAGTGFVQLYADSPLDGEPLAENVYLNLIASARRSLYVATPYLIISDEMTRALTLAAKRGVDVRVVTPGVPDKKLIYRLTRSYYAGLVRGGVRVYEYTPGFLHAKQVARDGTTAIVGTVNFDYRSLYHNFENACLFHGCAAVEDVTRDFEALFAQSREVTETYRTGRKAALRVAQCVARLFAPLL